MNERIEQLKSQCWVEKCIPHWDNGMWIEKHIDLEKFAELIVRDCLNQCYNRGMDDELYAGQLKAATYIEEYFGVEE